MSILAEVLAAAGQVEMEELVRRVNDVSKKIEEFKLEVTDILEKCYVRFLPHPNENKQILNLATHLFTDATDIKQIIDNEIKRDLSESTSELEDLKINIQEAVLSISMMKRLCIIRECLREVGNLKKDDKFYEAALKINESYENLNNAENELKSTEIYQGLIESLNDNEYMLKCIVVDKLKECIIWNSVSNNNKITLSVSKSKLKSDVFKTLYFYNFLSVDVNEFGLKLFNDILIPVIDKSATITILSDQDLRAILILEIKNEPNSSSSNVIQNLKVIFSFIISEFDIQLQAIKAKSSFITELGDAISSKFTKHFINNCLNRAVPDCLENIDSYEHVLYQLRHLENLLIEQNFLSADCTKHLKEYSSNVDDLICKKICDSYLMAGRDLIKADLSNSITTGTRVESLEVENTLQRTDIRTTREVKSFRSVVDDSLVFVSKLSVQTNQFPFCQISKSALDLLDLIERLLNESANSKSIPLSMKLLSTSKNILTLYCDIVQMHHKKLLDSFPVYSALLCNNSYYLAHHLVTMGSKYKAKLPVGAPLKNTIITFVDLIDTLLNVGNNALANQIEIQKKKIIETLNESGLSAVIELNQFPAAIEKSLRKCIRQFILLQKDWQNVLPTKTYCSSIGLLCNMFLEELIEKVASYSDIPAHTSSELVRVFKIVIDKIPAIFVEPNEIYIYVKKWTTFNELVKLLSGSLQDVEERWSDGKGPLALEFSSNQVKQFVKALFQVSRRRTDLINKIK